MFSAAHLNECHHKELSHLPMTLDGFGAIVGALFLGIPLVISEKTSMFHGMDAMASLWISLLCCLGSAHYFLLSVAVNYIGNVSNVFPFEHLMTLRCWEVLDAFRTKVSQDGDHAVFIHQITLLFNQKALGADMFGRCPFRPFSDIFGFSNTCRKRKSGCSQTSPFWS